MMGNLQAALDPYLLLHLVHGVILLTVVEGLGLYFYHRATSRGLPPQVYLLNLCSGLALMLALRSSLAGQIMAVTMGWIAAAGIAHAADLWRRWRDKALG
jgi:hypothetical protein